MEAAHGAKDVLDEGDETLWILYGDSRDQGRPTSGYVLRFRHSRRNASVEPPFEHLLRLRPHAFVGGETLMTGVAKYDAGAVR